MNPFQTISRRVRRQPRLLGRFIATSLALCAIASVAVPRSARGDPVVWSGNGHTYEAVPAVGISYAAARDACFARGGYLATITSPEEEAFVESLIRIDAGMWSRFTEEVPSCCIWYPEAPPYPGFCSCFVHVTKEYGPWFGGLQQTNSPEPAGNWVWRSYEPWSYAHWYSGQPDNNAPGGEFLAKFYRYSEVSDSTGIHVETTGWDDVSSTISIDKRPGYIFETCDASTDTDGDGLPDCWENPRVPGMATLNGVPVSPPGACTGFNQCFYERYPLNGSDPLHKDVYVEVDALIGREPDPGVLATVTQAFAMAPVSNPDNVPGVNLHVSLDDIQEPAVDWPNVEIDFDAYKNHWFGTAADRTATWLNGWSAMQTAKGRAYRYCVFGETHSGATETGWARSSPGQPRDFLVTLGTLAPTTGEEEAGTFMHYLGHALGLRHGGADDVDNKPNYQSVMNTIWQMPVRITAGPLPGCGFASPGPLQRYHDSWRLDYSAAALPALDEADLDENNGIGGDPFVYVPIGPATTGNGSFYPPHADIVPMGGPVNWDRVGVPHSSSAQADVNFVPECSSTAISSPGEILVGHEDWSTLQYAVPAPPGPARFDLHVAGDELTSARFVSMGALPLDCNANGYADQEDIDLGRSQDANANGVPDECDPVVAGVAGEASSRGLSLTLRRNPVLRGTTGHFEFSLLRAGSVKLRVYDATGALVANLVDGELAAGSHVIPWSGDSSHGLAPAGVFFVELVANGSRVSRKLVVL